MLQGLVISLPYCYLNTEVQSVVRNHYRRWQLIRTVGTGHMSGDKYFLSRIQIFLLHFKLFTSDRGSISASTAYTTVNKIDLHQVSPDHNHTAMNVLLSHNMSQ